MSYDFEEISYKSSDGIHTIHAEIYSPRTAPVGVIAIAHGMVDYVERYKPLIEYFTERGYVVAGNDHLGHGGSVLSPDDFGFFAKKGGTDFVLTDLNEMIKYLSRRYANLPLVLLGHSMGSFIARIYAVKYQATLSGLVIHGTAGPNPILPFGKALAAAVQFFRGERYRSKLLKKLTTGGYNKTFPKEEGHNAWLTRNTAAVSDKDKDERGAFTFTVSGYRDLFRMLGGANSKSWFKSYPKNLPTLVVSGEDDPVGNFGKGPRYVYNRLKAHGVERLDLKLYEGARHELYNEFNNAEVFNDIEAWLRGVK